jgi:vancomycin resistance protein YoaR
MSILNGNQKYWILGACAGVLVLAGGLCAILLSGKESTLAQPLPENTAVIATPSQPAASLTLASFVVGTPEIDQEAEKRRLEMEAVIIRDTMLPGTTIYGVDVGGMTREESHAAVAQKLAEAPITINLFLSDGANVYPASGQDIPSPVPTSTPIPDEEEDSDAVDPEFLAAEAAGAPIEEDEDEPGEANPVEAAEDGPVSIELIINIDKAVKSAFSLMRDGSLPYDEFMLQVKQISGGYDIAPTPEYDSESVDRYVTFLAERLDTPPVNAVISMENNQLVYTDEVKGHGIDKAALTASILSADPLSGDTIPIPMQELEPEITRKDLEGKYVKRGEGCKTGFSSSTKNRKYNIRFGADKINGTILKPGEIFSTNAVLGKRTRKNGWKSAGAYEGGEVVMQAGGGVCQLSSTLFNAVLKADLEIVERRNHSMPVSYLARGLDATINSVGNIIDFKFKNNTSGDIIILAYTEGNTLTMEIYGVPFETDEYDEIKVRTKQISSTSITTIYTDDPNKPTTYSKTTYKGHKGYKMRTYRDYYKNGVLVKSEDLGLSIYTMFPRKVTRGTKEVDSSSD